MSWGVALGTRRDLTGRQLEAWLKRGGCGRCRRVLMRRKMGFDWRRGGRGARQKAGPDREGNGGVGGWADPIGPDRVWTAPQGCRGCGPGPADAEVEPCPSSRQLRSHWLGCGDGRSLRAAASSRSARPRHLPEPTGVPPHHIGHTHSLRLGLSQDGHQGTARLGEGLTGS